LCVYTTCSIETALKITGSLLSIHLSTYMTSQSKTQNSISLSYHDDTYSEL